MAPNLIDNTPSNVAAKPNANGGPGPRNRPTGSGPHGSRPTGTSLEFYASCPEGFESALAHELRALGLRQIRPLKGRVTFGGLARDAYRACLWSRLASRVFVTLARFDARDAEDLYEGTSAIAWEHILREGATLAVSARGTTDELRNSHFSALRVKDAICDRLSRVLGERPSVDTDNPDARILLTLRGERASLHLDLTGDPLFKRLPREATRPGAAHVLRPDYAALLLAQGGWQDICAQALVNDRDEANIQANDMASDEHTATPAPFAENGGSAGYPSSAAASNPNKTKPHHASSEPFPAANADPGSTSLTAEPTGTSAAGPAVTTEPETSCPAFPVLLDLGCAGGGVVLEAASILADRAPGLTRTRWGFQGWAQHDEDAWSNLLDEARTREDAARHRAARIVATDISGDAVSTARRVLKGANLDGRVIFAQPSAEKIARKLSIPVASAAQARGLMVLDSTEVPLTKLSRAFSLVADARMGDCLPGAFGELTGDTLRSLPLAMLSRSAQTPPTCDAPTQEFLVKPNNEDALILSFASFSQSAAAQPADNDGVTSATAAIALPDGSTCPVLIPESDQFARRLAKVAKQRRKWAQREGVTCYRVYDADLPDYSAAIDLYEGSSATPGRWLVIAEYAAPRSVDPALAEARLLDILAIAPRVLNVDPENVFAKARIRSRGGSQYGKGSGGVNAAERTRANATGPNTRSSGARKSARGNANERGSLAQRATPVDIRTRHLPLVEEGGLTFAVNFNDYLDTGIFLDHRITRGLVRERAKSARYFLNLFAYTGTATCYAADAGVEETVTVDLSNTYLDWAERNMEQNGFTGPQHHYVRADVMSWIRDMRQTRNRWDLIFCDPPTFSNSSKMGQRTWDVQRDHVELLIGISRLLTREGEAIFSCNLRTFRPDTEELARAGVVLTDITAQTIPEDFARNQRIHKCYIVRRHTPEEAMRLAGMDEQAVRERTHELRERAQRWRS